ncbi:hypothetical protein MD484_g5161, partial [Candolleomyces efflorescens]
MDSQLTLINPEPPLELVLEKSSTPLNTRLLVNGKARYKVSTVDRDANITNVTDLRTNQVIATVQRRSFLSDKVKFPLRFGGKSLKKDDWMTPIKLDTGHEAWIINSESGKFLWRWDRALRMVEDTDQIIAFVKDEGPVFALCVKRSAESSLDEIIPGFIILEHRLRMGTKALRVAEGWGADERSTPLGTPLS